MVVGMYSCVSSNLSDFSDSKCPDSKNKKKHHKLMKSIAKKHKCKKGDYKCKEMQKDTSIIYPKFRSR